MDKDLILVIHFEFMNNYRNKEMGLFALHMAHKGYQIEFLTLRELAEDPVDWPENFKLVFFPTKKLSPWSVLKYIAKKRKRVAGIWTYMGTRVYRQILPFCYLWGIKTLLHLDSWRHDIDKPIPWWHKRAIFYHLCSAILCESPEMVEHFSTDYLKQKCIIYPCSFNLERVSQLNLDSIEKKNQIVYAGRIIPVKRLLNAVKAFAIILKEQPSLKDWKFIILGQAVDPEYTKLVKQEIEQSGFKDSFKFLGELHGLPFYQNMAESKIHVVPALKEAQSNAFADGMSMKATILTTDGCNVDYLLEQRQCGVVIEKENIPVLKDAMYKLMTDDKYRTRLAEKAHQRLLEKFNFKKNILKIESILFHQ